MTKKKQIVEHLDRSIQHLSPLNVIKRGYSISSIDGKIVRNISQLNKGDKIRTQISDGSFDSEVFDIKE